MSVVICAYNAAGRLQPTLEHLRRQQGTDGIEWEVLLVDNASTDGTASAAGAMWKGGPAGVPLRVAHEPRLGQAHARVRGLTDARYELVSFIDDDNWVCPEWIALVTEIMRDHPDAGACGGRTEAVYEVPPPLFFDRFASRLAVGPQGNGAGDVTDIRGLLWGAGLTLRRSAWLEAVNQGISVRVSGRRGVELTSCDDSELCLAIRLVGWRLWYDPRLTLQHFLPRQRLSWSYLRRLERGSGRGTIGLDGYYVALRRNGWRFLDRFRWSWQWQAFRALQGVARHPVKFFASRVWALEGDPDVLTIEQASGRCGALMRARGRYTEQVRQTALHRGTAA